MYKKTDFKLSSPHDVAHELGRRLKDVRLSKNMRQEELAQRAGVSRISVVLCDTTGLGSVVSFLRMSQALGKISELA